MHDYILHIRSFRYLQIVLPVPSLTSVTAFVIFSKWMIHFMISHTCISNGKTNWRILSVCLVKNTMRNTDNWQWKKLNIFIWVFSLFFLSLSSWKYFDCFLYAKLYLLVISHFIFVTSKHVNTLPIPFYNFTNTTRTARRKKV